MPLSVLLNSASCLVIKCSGRQRLFSPPIKENGAPGSFPFVFSHFLWLQKHQPSHSRTIRPRWDGLMPFQPLHHRACGQQGRHSCLPQGIQAPYALKVRTIPPPLLPSVLLSKSGVANFHHACHARALHLLVTHLLSPLFDVSVGLVEAVRAT